MNSAKEFSPGATIGILGGGQLGKMMSQSAKQMGYRVHVFTNIEDSPAGQVSDREWVGAFEDIAKVQAFAQAVDVVTIETENIPVPTLQAISEFASACPGAKALEVSQNRGLEKTFCQQLDIPTCEFRLVRSWKELNEACQTIMPGVLKTTRGGYDGKGQVIIRDASEARSAWEALNADECILEAWVEYDFEFSVVAARSARGDVVAYPSIRNEHRNHILDVSHAPSGLAEHLDQQAMQRTCKLLESLEAVGVLTVEFFCCGETLLVNEMAPRPHNSGHLTIEGHVTSQFEQHIRAVCGLNLGATDLLHPTSMANLLGDEWSQGEPDWDSALAVENLKLHLYGKETPKPGRKMGHMTSFSQTVEKAVANVLQARKVLSNESPELES